METIIASVIGVVGVIAAALVAKGELIFWTKSRAIQFSGKLFTAKYADGVVFEEPTDHELSLSQEIRAATLKHSGDKCRLEAEYLLTVKSEIKLAGTLVGKGSFHNGVAFMHYEIVSNSKQERWFGTMLLRVPDWKPGI